MARPVTVKLVGGAELAAAIQSMVDDFDISKATVRNTMRRALLEAGQVTADAASHLAPDDPNTPSPDLHTSIEVGTKLTDRQSKLNKKSDDKSFAQAFIGPTKDVNSYASLVEFGTSHSNPRPFMRPAWESTKDQVLGGITKFLKMQIDKSAARAHAKALRKAT